MNYEQYMHCCLELARKGEGYTSPNPLVGCIVLDKNNNIISEGFHEKYGKNHAERNALLRITPEQAQNGTLIVNLEPCSHYGKTPPCADLIIEYGIKKVVIGMRDVNPVVAGNGIKKLQDAGIDIIEGILEDNCKKLNEIFIKNMTEHRTFVAIKTASTLDGKIATANGSSKWITTENARDEVKHIRQRYDAILTSSATVLADNPSMLHKCNIILDRELKTIKEGASSTFHYSHSDHNAPESFTNEYKIYKNDRVIVFHDEKLESPIAGAEFVKTPVIDGKLDIEFVFNELYKMGIMSVLIESGGHLNGSALQYADKIYHFIAPKILGDNNGRSCFDFRTADNINIADKFHIENIEHFEPDILLTYYPLKKDS